MYLILYPRGFTYENYMKKDYLMQIVLSDFIGHSHLIQSKMGSSYLKAPIPSLFIILEI